eukprot:14269_1
MSSTRNRGGRKRDNKKQKSPTKLSNIKLSNKPKKDGQSLWTKAIKGVSDNEWTKEDVSNIIYWLRQILSLIIGMLWGIVRLEGIFAVLLYFTVCVFGLHSYKSQYGVSDEIFDIFDALKEGFVPALGIFLMGWVCSYSIIHYD